MSRKEIYLDNSLSAKPTKEVLSAVVACLGDKWGAVNAPYKRGQELLFSYEKALRSIYKAIGASEEETILLTATGAEAVSHVIQSVYRDLTIPRGKNHFLCARTDEASALVGMEKLADYGCVAERVEVDSRGLVTVGALAEALTPRTALFSLSWGNGLTGVIQEVAPLAELCRERGVLFHLDATHILGKVSFNLKELGTDYLSCHGEPLHATPGAGFLYMKREHLLAPLIFGGSEQRGLRGGNINLPATVGLGVALEQLVEARDYLCTEVARLRDRFEQGVRQGFPSVRILFEKEERLPHISCIAFPGIAGEAFLFGLDREGVAASCGGGGLQQLGQHLIACGVEDALAHSAVSFSLSRLTTEEEIEEAIEKVLAVVGKLSKLSVDIMKPSGGVCGV